MDNGVAYGVILDGFKPKSTDLDSATRLAAARAYDEGSIPAPIDGDFPAFGKAYRALDAEHAGELGSAAVERHHALNWLCGRGADWDKVPTDT